MKGIVEKTLKFTSRRLFFSNMTLYCVCSVRGLPGTERNPFFFTIMFINLDFFILKLLSFTSFKMQPEVSGRIKLLPPRRMELCFDTRAFSFTGGSFESFIYEWNKVFLSWREMKDGIVPATMPRHFKLSCRCWSGIHTAKCNAFLHKKFKHECCLLTLDARRARLRSKGSTLNCQASFASQDFFNYMKPTESIRESHPDDNSRRQLNLIKAKSLHRLH